MSGPPQLSDEIKIPKESDLPSKSTSLPSESVVDFLLLTVKPCEFLSCFIYLQNPSRYYKKGLGHVYIGKMGDEDEDEKLKVALMKCDMGSGVGGSAMAVKNAVTTLKPKGVLCVGFCGGMNAKKAKLGDVVLSSSLISYAPVKVTTDGIQHRGSIVPLFKNLNDLVSHAGDGWKPPVKDSEQGGKVVPGKMLSGPELVNDTNERDRLLKQYPDAIAIEMEGEGVYTAAHDLQTEWVVVKGISDYADGTKDDTEAWKTFASVMAASVVANILNNPVIFEEWPHYGGASAVAPKRPCTRSSLASASSQGDKGTLAETSGVAKKARKEPSSSSASNRDDNVKDGEVSKDDLEKLANLLGAKWESLGRRLLKDRLDCESVLTGLRTNVQEFSALSAKALKMLMLWKETKGKYATYHALKEALCHDFVQCRLFAEQICDK
ncbi:uncharacterized protein LOC144639215 [Oculina patagonica]